MNWFFLVGRSYLWPRRRKLPDTTLLLPCLGLTIGIAALIAVLSGMNGFQHLLINDLQEISSYHLRLTRPGKPISLADLDELSGMSRVGGVKNVTAFVESPMLLSSPRGRQVMPLVRAVDPEGFVRDLGRSQAMPLQWGGEDFIGANQIIIGEAISFSLGVGVGDSLQVFSLGRGARGELVELQRSFVVQAVYRSSTQEVERNLVFIQLNKDVLPLFGQQSITLGLKLFAAHQWYKIAPRLQVYAGDHPFKMVSTYQYNRGFFTALRTEKTVLLLLVSMIFLVMVLQIYQSLRRLVLQYRQEVAILRALGAGRFALQGIFLLQSLLVALMSMTVGSGLGVLMASHLAVILGWIGQWLRASSQSFLLLRSGLQWGDVLLVNALVLVFCLIAGYLAAKPTTRMLPASILRCE